MHVDSHPPSLGCGTSSVLTRKHEASSASAPMELSSMKSGILINTLAASNMIPPSQSKSPKVAKATFFGGHFLAGRL